MSGPSEIALEDASAGMILAADLLDAHGTVLVPRETALTEGLLAALRRRGVERCVVAPDVDVDLAVLERDRALERERQLQRLERLFRHATGAGSLLLLERLRAYRGGSPS
ncbi:hypothetical protein [Pseudoduganella chitinolytica]|uniref:Uncharacterized protein n=1 Tax=Pseudoduganella chitinolytica TaxID=34070 RepID=A0ABY8BGF1_9BURK|nr:hypothetical protein [Pseudoduganella chitinolytica]WEF34766.1 hypothetical protein PX653_08400 [Pseudoduganella chitinolytica]